LPFAIAALSANIALAEVEPTTAFGQAYEIAVKATEAHLQSTTVNLTPTAGVERRKNVEGLTADFHVRVDIKLIGHR